MKGHWRGELLSSTGQGDSGKKAAQDPVNPFPIFSAMLPVATSAALVVTEERSGPGIRKFREEAGILGIEES